jgi:hypothetical protein
MRAIEELDVHDCAQKQFPALDPLVPMHLVSLVALLEQGVG